MKIDRKINLSHPVFWETHRVGWKYVIDTIKENFHDQSGTIFLGAVENVMISEVPILEPWVGVVHQVPRHHMREFPDLVRLLKSDNWVTGLKFCKGLFVISKYVQEYLESMNLGVPINHLYYPIDSNCLPFDYTKFSSNENRKKLLLVGEYLRRFETFEYLNAPNFRKIILNSEEFEKSGVNSHEIDILERVSDEDYDILLSESVIFVDLIDAPANTLVIECIIRNTPILINRLPGIEEYLGENYPFYFDSIEEASQKLNNDELIKQTHLYLKSSKIKPLLSKESFIDQLANSQIYKSLPTTEQHYTSIKKSFDVSLVICSYNRVYNIDNLLNCFCNQDYEGSFEIILWNNNIDKRDELEEIVSRYKSRLNINLIHSTENYYCAIRLAAVSLIRSELLLICDDDVIPSTSYISYFLKKHEQYGSEAVICCRGHRFLPHVLDEENPQLAWQEHQYLKFYDETKEDRTIHFFHADNCLIPKAVLLRANEFDWPTYDFILIDDYWLSYIINHELDIPIWKVQADQHMNFTPCSEDPNIALFHNEKVTDQRVNFYIYHMRHKWPNFKL